MTESSLVQGNGRLHINNPLMRESLVSSSLTQKWEEGSKDGTAEQVRLLPWATLINIGGSSILDRGAEAILPLLDEVVSLREKHPIIVSVGGGARMRHTLEIATDLGLPTGGLAQVVGAVEEQNSHIVHALLSKHGGVSMCREHFAELPKYLMTGMIPIVISVPPYHYWEPPPRHGRLPDNGSDLGAYLTAEVLGVERMIFIKDQPGWMSAPPATQGANDDSLTMLSNLKVSDALAIPPGEMPLEYSVLESMQRARNVKEVQIINGLEKGALTKAMEGQEVGTRLVA